MIHFLQVFARAENVFRAKSIIISYTLALKTSRLVVEQLESYQGLYVEAATFAHTLYSICRLQNNLWDMSM